MKLVLTEQILVVADSSTLAIIERSCTYKNPKFYDALRQGYSTRNIPAKLYLSAWVDEGLIIPIGMLSSLLTRYQHAELIDRRSTAPVNIPFTGTLRPYQQKFVTDAINAQSGLMVAATGAGKTISAIALASILKQRTLVLVKSKDLAEQWRESIHQFTGLEAGQIGGGKNAEGEQFTICLVQTLVKRDLSSLNYGLVFADECHNAPASQFYQVINGLNSRYKFGLSATPQRRDNLEFMIYAAIGLIAAEVKPEQLQDKVLPVKIYPVGCPFDTDVSSWQDFINALVNDDQRNNIIVQAAQRQRKPTIILTSQVRHAEILTTLTAESGLHPLLIHGQLPAKLRAEQMAKAAK